MFYYQLLITSTEKSALRFNLIKCELWNDVKSRNTFFTVLTLFNGGCAALEMHYKLINWLIDELRKKCF